MKKRPEQYGWKLKKITDGKFWDWYTAQDNINDSLITLVNFFIKEYGIRDVKDFDIEEKMHRSLILKEEMYQDLEKIKQIVLEANINVSPVHHVIQQVPNSEIVDKELNLESHSAIEDKLSVLEENPSTEQAENRNEKVEIPKKEDNVFSNVDTKSIF
ncbi:hypothetical protein COL32_27825 [Bacillus pseudomycoides]|uniref:hypothetical protein n=1 Tax=Bacillus pseudomycoides TaxID=64104 RepID=UPI000BF87BDA|nr:hypothetical protein [Bacillus pseudomycoides]PFX36778.1 hypothetical protein COL32_27825 [Bacillus pseudomycoides]